MPLFFQAMKMPSGPLGAVGMMISDNLFGPDNNGMYLGAPVFLDGHAVGTLCFAFVDFHNDNPAESATAKRFIEMQAARVGKALEALLQAPGGD